MAPTQLRRDMEEPNTVEARAKVNSYIALAACNETCGIYKTAFWQQQGQLRECHIAYKALNTDYGKVVNERGALVTSNLNLRYELDEAYRTIEALALKLKEPCSHIGSGASPAGTGHREIDQADCNLAGQELALRGYLKTKIKQLEQEKADMQQEYEREKADLMQAHQVAMSNAADCILTSERKIEELRVKQCRSEPQEGPLVTSPELMSF
ncbi:hypothetical protein LTR28_009533 [Elasticomyces elasticus]|nr:hypothetical protein LTR28_009533 [Elasticomyces elasticus]KAK4987395.1 hypothetical protein LTR50_004632 [Elasticomyces elasticus]